MTSIRLTHTALAIAVAAALTSGVAAAAEQTMPSVNTDVLTGQSGDTLKTVSHQEYENKGTIKNFGSVRISVSGEVIPGAAQRGCPLFFVMQYARPDAIARVV